MEGYVAGVNIGRTCSSLVHDQQSNWFDPQCGMEKGSGQQGTDWLPAAQCRRVLRTVLGAPSVWEEYLPLHCAALRAMAANAPEDAYTLMDKALPHFTRVRKSSATLNVRHWLLAKFAAACGTATCAL